ncbi:TMEM175 family protein [Hymenobacter terricola]|uniref:TMEM175 family protein n=1 Tax=Hymenobacter terricola TaxID=2819236 RepID=UPI001B302C6E|nr:TMEM175 family protein [Hymenobacter terricola]
MQKGRLEAFSDGVIAIIITIMVLEIKRPHGDTLAALKPVLPVLLGYALSFVYVGIYWNNHHHLLAGVTKIDGRVLWANLHLLFWLSLIPFATDWMGENHFAPATLAVYGAVLFMAAMTFNILQRKLIALNGPDSVLARAVAHEWKGRLSPLFYALGVAACFWNAWVAGAIYVALALGWLVPNRRIERPLPPASAAE